MINSEAQILWRMLRGQPRDGSHRQKLERFYAPQAGHYDAFRERLLPGRAEMLSALCIRPEHHVVDLGCGTARNLEFIGNETLRQVARIDAVDLCPSLLEKARERCQQWPQVNVIDADAAKFDPGQKVDRVYLSYALTMIPEWRETLRNAYRMLRPGGIIGVVDFSLKHMRELNVLSRLQQQFWKYWFAHDGVRLNEAHPSFLDGLFERIERYDQWTRVPYVPLLKVPYYIYIGRK